MTRVLPDIPASIAIRDELESLVLADLLGPAGGEEEEIEERSVRDRYLVGMLAPRRQELSPEEFDENQPSVGGSPEDGMPEAPTLSTKTMFPSSFGMTFCVEGATPALTISAHWGHYEWLPGQTLEKADGEKRKVWKRSPRGGTSLPIPITEGRLASWAPDRDRPDVKVKGLIRKRDGSWTITLFLVNDQDEPKKLRDSAWLFQPELAVQSPDGAPVFHSRLHHRGPGKGDPVTLAEEQEMAMLYRHQVEFGVGHGVSIQADVAPDRSDRAVRLRTRVVPSYEVPRTTPPTAADWPDLDGLVVDMKTLSEAPTPELTRSLSPLVTAYENWIGKREAELSSPDLKPFATPGASAIDHCKTALSRIRQGLALLETDETAARAFRFANGAMWQQRIHSILAQKRRRDEPVDAGAIDVPKNRAWYPFQLAFLLLNLPGLTRLDHPDRTGGHEAIADLLWFPTGGGKTEAYLGLTAYTLAMRRLAGPVSGRSGEHGVAVLMRYTLRLLTIQQFQRATALICACEMIRRSDPATWGREPFRIGLWVGQRTTPNTTAQAAESIREEHGGKYKGKGGGSPAQLTNCPWCGLAIDPGKHIKVESYEKGRCRTVMFCSDPMGQCPFSPRQSPEEGIPAMVVDDEIYRRLPALLIATVDKFAQMPWNGKIQMLFGQVDGYCDRHGFRSPMIDDADSHPRKDRLPPAKTEPRARLRPPDLIIQDELHLIAGPLGSLVGLYETAVDRLCSWTVDGKTVRPKVVASTATIRKAGDQIHAVFLRAVNVFPPHGLDVRDNFFALSRPSTEEVPGRRYIGICAPGRRSKVALIRVYVALMSAAQMLYEKKGYGSAVDPWMTVLGYFNSMRELGSTRRLVDDDVKERLKQMDRRGLARRLIQSVDELTSRKGAGDIPQVLDHLEVMFDPAADARRRKAASDEGKHPLDVLLATNMVSVGVDVPRLGTMVVAGQPKTTAEYIQATSRVGRRHPGLVFTVFHWTRPRDLSHYETFEHYHATFYKHVEALSVTPFARGALNRGLAALLASCVRLSGSEFNLNHGAGRIEAKHPYVQQAIATIVKRAELVADPDDERIRNLEGELRELVDNWLAEAQKTTGGRMLGYDDESGGLTVSLLKRPGMGSWTPFTCLTSLREVEPMVGLILHDGGLDEEDSTGDRNPVPESLDTDPGEEDEA